VPSRGLGFGLVLLAAARGNPQRIHGAGNHAAGEVQQVERCARAVYWLQKSVRGVGLREAIPVAAGVGDEGLAPGYGKPPWSETTSRIRSFGDGWSVQGSAEGHLLVKGVSGRGSLQPSRAAGGTGLGLVAHGASARCGTERQETSEFRLPRLGSGQ